MITDYKPFLHITEDGRIWWSLKDAIRLGAGFLPVRDDHQTQEIELRAPNDSALVNEGTLIGAFGDARLTIDQPMTFERDGFHYVDAEGFLSWISQYIAQTQAKIAFPNELASKVKIAKAKAEVSKSPVKDQEFESLTLALDDCFDKNLEDLPKDLRQRVERDFFPFSWDGLSADQRHSRALQWDSQHDPATENERQYWWNYFTRLHDLQDQVEQWQSTKTPTASDLAEKESRLKELQQEIDRMKVQQRQEVGDYTPERKRLDGDKRETPTTDFIAYPKAMKILREKWMATQEELAIWIFLGPEKGGIAAYKNANELTPPPRFYFAYWQNEDYLPALMYCWFQRDDIERFEPADRYITGTELIERWSKYPGILPKPFIIAKIEESRLIDYHPTFGGTQGTFDEQKNFPSLETGLFPISQIERIEAEDELDSAPVQQKSDVKPDQNLSHEKGGRPKSPLSEAVEKAYLHFRDKGDVTILQPGNIRSFLKSFKALANDEYANSKDLGNRKIRAHIAERIKEVKIRYPRECLVITQERKEGNRLNPSKRYKQKDISLLLSNLRKKYPLPS